VAFEARGIREGRSGVAIKQQNQYMESREKLKLQTVINAIRESKGMVYVAARRLDCHPCTIYAYARRHPTVQAAIDDARGMLLDEGETALYNAVLRGEGWAVCFLLKTLGKTRGYVERQEVHIEEDRPIRLVPTGVGRDVLEAFRPLELPPGDEYEN
jgi:hypothetical protein